MKRLLLASILLFTLNTANAGHFVLTDTLVKENDTLITTNLNFKTHKKTKEESLHRKSIPFLDSLVSFMTYNNEVEIEIIRFHSPMVRPDHKFLGTSCKIYAQLDLIANYLADWGVHILRIRLRECKDYPIAKNFDQENLTIIRITKAPELEETNPLKRK